MSQTLEAIGIKYLQGSPNFSEVTANFKLQKKHSLGREYDFVFVGFVCFSFSSLVFRESSIFLQHLQRVNNQEHAAGGAGKGPENMGVMQGTGQMLARFPMCRGE